ncbi:cell division ATP-binding protein FtsE [Lawsonibacter sp. LCP25S3_G6]|uniref:cell division ATP-binding protein FtsE n=1 Tax=unclassified Lawsonibacter TaxID=2617946 RepID=UPI003F97D2A6
MALICLEGAGKDYTQTADQRVVHAIRSVDLTIEQGEFVFITGSSGAGKSTLLQLIAYETQPSQGKVCLDGVNVNRLSQRQRQNRRLRFGYVPQFPSLIRKRTIQENLSTVALLGRDRIQMAPDKRVQKALNMVGMGNAADRYPVELSMGECRRVELARAIINNPDILVLDELTANLDEDTAWDMFLFLSELNHHGVTVIMASHAKKFVNLMRRRVITLVDGAILGDVQKGRYGDVV